MRVAVVGGGVAGLTAAYDLGALGHDVIVLEGSSRVGGKLLRRPVAGVAVDVGAEAMLARRPEGVDLARALGLPLVHPATASSRVWTRGALRPLPRSLMGVPTDLGELEASGVLTPEGLARVRKEPSLPPSSLSADVSVGDLVAERLGEEVTDRLVEPLLGGVYAGRSREISARAAVPQLVAMAGRGSLLEQAAALPPTAGPVFAGLAGGMGQLPEALAASGRFEVRTGEPATALERSASGWQVVRGSSRLRADAVVLATPAAPTARLLADVAPGAAAELERVEYASTAVVTLAFRAADVPELEAVGSSGFLVPPVEERRIKASTFSFAKWEWVRAAGDGLLLLRTSLGRHREATALQAGDDRLVAWSLADLADAVGLSASPVDTDVQRWGGGLPQYAVGHVDRVARVRAAVAELPLLAVCGAAYDGVGIPAAIASARRAVADLGGERPAPTGEGEVQ